jgi:hypothetical protein
VCRTCYDDEAAWQKLRAEICDVKRSFDTASGRYLIDRHKPVFMDEKAEFDGADRVIIRDHFREWSKAELDRNLLEPISSRSHVPDERQDWLGPRYNMFGVVDDVCIESVHRGQPLLMLVAIDWEPLTAENMMSKHGQYHTDWEDGIMIDHTEGPGGWIYTEASRYVEYYGNLTCALDWTEDFMFMYPSLVYQEMGLDKSPGFWREEMAARQSSGL